MYFHLLVVSIIVLYKFSNENSKRFLSTFIHRLLTSYTPLPRIPTRDRRGRTLLGFSPSLNDFNLSIIDTSIPLHVPPTKVIHNHILYSY